LMNGLLRMGWSHGDDEIIPTAKALEWFGLDGLGKAPARLDPEKLASINAHYIEGLGNEGFVDAVSPFLEKAPSEAQKAMLTRGGPFLKARMKLLADINAAAGFVLLERPFEITGKPAKPLKKEGAMEHLGAIKDLLEGQDDWSPAALDERLQGYAEGAGVGFGQVGPALRAALTAGQPSPSIGETLHTLGQDEALARIHQALSAHSS
ncbi:MAG: glutamate--tRNA ligase, partial [Pseudomonadota bacterium]